jgi:cystathionine beta-lyase/cystathionine gamma-synthase
VSAPVVHSATFSHDLETMIEEERRGPAGSFYQRLGHPTLHACEQRLAALAGAEEALLFASGMAAITAVYLANLAAGDHVVALRQCYGGTLDALQWGVERLGWRVTWVDVHDPAGWERAFTAGTRLFHVESPTNPVLSLVDLAHAAAIAHRHGAKLCVDSTVASPLGQRPLELGADLVALSATKSIGGHSDLLAGVVLGSRAELASVWRVRAIFGAVPDPSVAWLIERSTKTLALRVERANASALDLARRLARDERVARVFYPGLESHPGHAVAARQMSLGFGPLLSFEVRGGLPAAEAVARGLVLVRHAPSLGGVESLASLPAHTSHRHLSAEERAVAGIPEGLVRLSVGIEDVDDLWADLDRALASVSAARSEV